MKYKVFHVAQCEMNEMAEFDSLDEAVSYCEYENASEEPFEGDPDTDLCSAYCLEIWSYTGDYDEAMEADEVEMVYQSDFYVSPYK